MIRMVRHPVDVKALYEAWVKHIEDTPGHPGPASESLRGGATYLMNVAGTYIRCCVCDWEQELRRK